MEGRSDPVPQVGLTLLVYLGVRPSKGKIPIIGMYPIEFESHPLWGLHWRAAPKA